MLITHSTLTSAEIVVHPPKDEKIQTEKREAALKIFRTWKKFHATIDLLRDHSLASLSRAKFKPLLKKLQLREMQKRVNKHYLKHLNDAINDAIELRLNHHQEHMAFPVFTDVDDENYLPVPGFFTVDDVDLNSYTSFDGIRFTSNGLKRFTSSLPVLPSFELLTKLTLKIQKIDLFPWNYLPEGCNERADLTLLFLRVMKIPAAHLYKIHICAPSLNYQLNENKQIQWTYHVAPMVILLNRSKWVIDPLLHPSRPLSPEEWVERMSEKEVWKMEESIFTSPGFISYSPDKPTVLMTTHNIKLTNHSFYIDRTPMLQLYEDQSNDLYEYSLRQLSKWRFTEEEEYLKDLIKWPCRISPSKK